MNKERFSGIAITAILIALSAPINFSCLKRPAAVKQPAIESSTPHRGPASFTILTVTPKVQSSGASTYKEIIPPRPIGELRSPAYPENALKSKFGSARFIVRVHLDDTGQVNDIGQNPLEATGENRFRQEFLAEIDKAVRQWKFQPAKVQECRKGRDLNGDGKIDYTIVISTEKIPAYFDVQFEFSIVDGKGLAHSR